MMNLTRTLLAIASIASLASPAVAWQQAQAPSALLEAFRLATLDDQFGVVRSAKTTDEFRQTRTDVLEAPNPAQSMVTRFQDGGIAVAAGDTEEGESRFELRLALESWGRAGDMRPVLAAKRVVEGRRVEHRRGPVTEWYINGPSGLEQGFTLASRPGPGGDLAPLQLRLSVGGGFDVKLLPDGRGARFFDQHGPTVVSYTGLVAWDALGRDLETYLAWDGSGLSIVVEEADAKYPITIDPLIAVEEAELAVVFNTLSARVGLSVSLDGDTALVGAPLQDAGLGAAFVFVRSGTTWTEQAKLNASDADANDLFGGSVSISGDTALVGSVSDDDAFSNAGSVYVFVRSGTTWTEQAKLTASDAAAGDSFGISVSFDGDTALIGAGTDRPAGGGLSQGSAYVFVRSGTTWTEQAKLVASDGSGADFFGSFVSLEGETALIGASGDRHSGVGPTGSAYVFVRSGTTWTEQAKLIAGDPGNNDNFGFSVSLSGATALVGSMAADAPLSNSGAAYVFVRTGTTWTQQAKLAADDGTADDFFGFSVSLLGDTTLIGAKGDGDTGGAGTAYLFTRTGTTWSQESSFFGSNTDMDAFGHSVSLSGDSALVGAPATNLLHGTSFVFRLVDAGEWIDLGNALAGTNGTPSLTGAGTLVGGSTATTLLSGALENAQDFLVIGAFTINVPFKGGILVPETRIVLAVTTTAAGEFTTSNTIPMGMQPGVSLYLQHWIRDSGGPFGFAASNALQMKMP